MMKSFCTRWRVFLGALDIESRVGKFFVGMFCLPYAVVSTVPRRLFLSALSFAFSSSLFAFHFRSFFRMSLLQLRSSVLLTHSLNRA